MKAGTAVTLADGRKGVVAFVGDTHTNVTVEGEQVCVANSELQPPKQAPAKEVTPAAPAPVPPPAATKPPKQAPAKEVTPAAPAPVPTPAATTPPKKAAPKKAAVKKG